MLFALISLDLWSSSGLRAGDDMVPAGGRASGNNKHPWRARVSLRCSRTEIQTDGAASRSSCLRGEAVLFKFLLSQARFHLEHREA